MLGIRGEGLVYSADGESSTRSARSASRATCRTAAAGTARARRRPDHRAGRVLRRRGLQRLAPLRRRQGRLPRRAHRDPRRRGLRPLLRLPDAAVLAGRPRMPRSRPSCARALDAAYARFRAGDIARRARRARRAAGRAVRRATSSTAPSATATSTWRGSGRCARPGARPRAPTRRPQHHRPHRRLHLRHQPAAADAVDEGAASGPLRADEAGRRRRTPRAAGLFWVEPDTNLPGGESLVRQALVGRRFLQEEFGLADDDLRLCWLPDTFGYNGNLPQILRKSGMDWFLTIKLVVEQGQRLPAPHLHLGGHRRLDRARAHAARGRLQQPRRGRRAAHGPAAVPRARPRTRRCWSTARATAAADRARSTSRSRAASRTCAASRRSSTRQPADFFRALEKREIAHTPRRRALPRDPPGHLHDAGRDQEGQPGRRAQAARGRGAGRDPGDEQPSALEPHLARRAAEPVPRHPARLVDRAGQPRGRRDARADRGELDAYIAELRRRSCRGRSTAAPALNLTWLRATEHVKVDGDWYRAVVGAVRGRGARAGGRVPRARARPPTRSATAS